jgi:hypothetical protein
MQKGRFHCVIKRWKADKIITPNHPKDKKAEQKRKQNKLKNQ